MTKVNNVPYAVRNDLCARLNKSARGTFLDDMLRRGSIHALKIANSPKLISGLVKLLNEHPAVLVREVASIEDGTKRWWAISTKKGMDRSPPNGYVFTDEVVNKPAQETKYDARPEPSPVVYSTKPVETNNAFESLRNVAQTEVEPNVTEKPADNEICEQPQEKDPVMTDSYSALSQAALLRKQAEEMTALAVNLEREDSAVKRLDELRPVQLEIARATAVLQRTSDEMMDALETLEKASEKLRALVTMR